MSAIIIHLTEVCVCIVRPSISVVIKQSRIENVLILGRILSFLILRVVGATIEGPCNKAIDSTSFSPHIDLIKDVLPVHGPLYLFCI